MQSFMCDRCNEPIKPKGPVFVLVTTLSVMNPTGLESRGSHMKPSQDLCGVCFAAIDRAFETPPRPLEGMYKPGER